MKKALAFVALISAGLVLAAPAQAQPRDIV